MGTNILSTWPSQAPIVFDATADSLIQDAQDLIDKTNTVWDAIVKNVGTPDKATFGNTILPIINDENAKVRKSRILRFYASTSPSKELRDASNAATTLFNNAGAELYSRVDIFPLVHAVVAQVEGAGAGLDAQSKHYLRKLHRKMHMNGCAIHDPKLRSAFEEINKRVQELERQCLSNLDEDTSGLWVEPHELSGVPQSILTRLKKGDPDSPHQGKLWVKTKVPLAGNIIPSATNPATRKKIYCAIKNRLPQNVLLFRELVLARDSTARMLGYSSWLAYKASDKMVQTPETVTSLLADIRERICPAALTNVSELLAIKREVESDPDAAHLFAWDEGFYSGIQKERNQPERSNVSEYFELDNTLVKLLQLFGRLFGTQFERITPNQQAETGKPLVWHEDVRMYAVWDADANDADARFLGYAYFDLFPREGKYGHRGCYALGWPYIQPDGQSVRPSCALVMNFIKPADNAMPVLLELIDVRRLFHELGHLHHTICGKTKHASLAYIDRDFAEAPCLMLELLFWKESYIKDLSHHYSYLSADLKAAWLATAVPEEQENRSDPPLKLPDATVTLLAKKNLKQTVSNQVFNLFLSLYDVLVHNPATHEDLENMKLAVEFNKLRADITGLAGGEADGDGWEWGQGQSVFRMIVSGYDAGYYTYVLGRVYSLEMWEASGLDDTEVDDEQAGRRFRRQILEVGAGQPEMETLERYLGRTPSTRPYFEWLGI
ncbi:MepB protein [Cercophora newfieldiana]|uniref:MepB protein n=1 Tax=Cercophora newfieldiana TaxID=92897 RepID=A0AA39Y901_9PEZI|nr:MepB protein [Cercophora newfieldiana]